jgi:hypothetical protein
MSNNKNFRIMENQKNFRVIVMSYAHSIYTNISCISTWSACLKKAWRLYKLSKQMRQGTVHFFYQKVSGAIREAYGTLQNLPAGITTKSGNRKAKNYSTLCYFDVKKQQFRSFRAENLLAVIA